MLEIRTPTILKTPPIYRKATSCDVAIATFRLVVIQPSSGRGYSRPMAKYASNVVQGRLTLKSSAFFNVPPKNIAPTTPATNRRIQPQHSSVIRFLVGTGQLELPTLATWRLDHEGMGEDKPHPLIITWS